MNDKIKIWNWVCNTILATDVVSVFKASLLDFRNGLRINKLARREIHFIWMAEEEVLLLKRKTDELYVFMGNDDNSFFWNENRSGMKSQRRFFL
jgi:hypothetical protein